jgi:beta-1,4-mannosyl-glycoprotein beta-1,4-N-acetylglucosaminyltransferase
MKIYDCFQFFNEIDLLEIRLELLYNHVDYFVISETNKTHSNKDKELFFENNKKIFSKYFDKIIHIKEEMPSDILNPIKKQSSNKYDIEYNKIIDIFNIENENGLKEFPTFARDYMQREFIKLGLINCEDDDIIMVSDLDEIPNPNIIGQVKEKCLVDHCIMMDCHNYYINNIAHTNWYGNYIVYYEKTKFNSLTYLRNDRVNISKIFDGGWHLSFVGGPERIKTKIQSYSHQEFNNSYYLDNINNKINLNSDLFNRTNHTYQDKIQKYYFDNLQITDLNTYSYPKRMIDFIKNKYPYLIKT